MQRVRRLLNNMEVEKPKETQSDEKKDNNHNEESKVENPMTIQTPFWSRIKNSKRILLSGCGGGFDIYQGIPLYFTLKQMGYEVFFANYTFCYDIENEEKFEFLYDKNDKEKNDPLVIVVSADKVSQDSIKSSNYFPEYYLSLYFKEKQKQNVPIYTFPHFGYKLLCQAYELLVDKLNIDTVITIDGGTDSLMKGNECGVGTVEEDYNSIFAVEAIKNKNVTQKMLICLGLGVDRYHGVSDVSTLRAIAELTQTSSYLGCIQCLPYQQPCIYYREASEFAYKFMQHSISIVGSSILTSIEGKFGDEHWKGNYRTNGSKLFINPLMSIYWIFDNHGVYERINKEFKDEWNNCESGKLFNEVRTAVKRARQKIKQGTDFIAKHENYPSTTDLKHQTML